MEHNFNLGDRESFKINPHVWLRTLLAIVGDKEQKQEAVRRIVQKTGFPPDKVELLLATTIKVLIDETRAN